VGYRIANNSPSAVDSSELEAVVEGASRAVVTVRSEALAFWGILSKRRPELFTNYPTTPHYHIYAVVAALVLQGLIGALVCSLLQFSGFSGHHGDA
jgi:hypothetical protein